MGDDWLSLNDSLTNCIESGVSTEPVELLRWLRADIDRILHDADLAPVPHAYIDPDPDTN